MAGHEGHLRVTVVAGEGRRELTAGSEREIALMAESVLRRLAGESLAVRVRIEGASVGAQERLAAYLADVALELDLHWS